VDLELLAGARLDVRLVGCAGVVIGLGANDRRAGVLREDRRLDLGLGVTGQCGRATTVAADLRMVLSTDASPFVGWRAPILISARANHPVVR
jgi:hypothetical protein